MANTTTLAQMKARALDLADMPSVASSTGSTFINDSRLTDWANDNFSELWDLIVGANESYIQSANTVMLVAGTETYALPGDFYKELKTYYVHSDGRREPMRRVSRDEIDSEFYNWEFSDYAPYEYDIRGQNLVITPIPTASAQTVLQHYVPMMTPLVNGTDAVPAWLPIGWEKFVIYGMAIECLGKEESDASGLMAKKAAMQARIMGMLATRDLGEQRAIVNYYRTHGRRHRYWMGWR